LLSQKARDRRAGLNTAGFVSGYRGSPLGGLDQQFLKIASLFAANEIHFEPGLNEELVAATAIWGAQQAELRGEGRFDGVFGLWYGKGPGVDRSGDAFRHANLAGTSRHGGVLALMGDDATAESSTTAHQSEFAFVDAMMPILAPAGVQEILDYGALGWGLSRYAGVWVGLKCVKDTVESTAVVDASLDRVAPVEPKDFPLPPGGLAIRRVDGVLAQEERLHEAKLPAVVAWLAANRLDRLATTGGEATATNLAAFNWGRALAADPSALAAFMRPAPAQSDDSLEALRERRAGFLIDYQDRAYAERYRANVALAAKAERDRAPGTDAFARAVARGLFKLMAYKDEYEVARLYSDGVFAAELKDAFDGDLKLTFYLAPSWLARGDGRGGEPKKIVYGAWMTTALRLLARPRRLRGTRFDPFGSLAERRAERAMIADYEALIAELCAGLTADNRDLAVSFAALPETICGYGPVKTKAIAAANEERRRLLDLWRAPPERRQAAE
jgi:hypothetical protein